MDDLLKGLIHEGGGYLLAAVGFYLLYRMDQLRVADLKAIHARESGITATLIEVLTENTAALTSLADEIAVLSGQPHVPGRGRAAMAGRMRKVADATRPGGDDTWSDLGKAKGGAG